MSVKVGYYISWDFRSVLDGIVSEYVALCGFAFGASCPELYKQQTLQKTIYVSSTCSYVYDLHMFVVILMSLVFTPAFRE